MSSLSVFLTLTIKGVIHRVLCIFRLLKSVEVFEPRRNRWRILNANMCCGRKAMGVAVYDNRIWVAGGFVQSGNDSHLQAVSHVDCYHPEEKR